MTNGWEESAQAWIASMGQKGDWSREYVLDPAMTKRLEGRTFALALDVGCGEGRFCRILQRHGIDTIGVEPTPSLLDAARQRDPSGDYRPGVAEKLEFDDASFDLVVTYLTLIDIEDFRTAINEMTRVLRPGGTLLMANLTSFFSAGSTQGSIRDETGRFLHYPVDHYLEESGEWFEWDDIRIKNWHRPLTAYMRAFLECGLRLTYFDEPEPTSVDHERSADYRRAPWFLVMEWQRPPE